MPDADQVDPHTKAEPQAPDAMAEGLKIESV